MSSDGRHKVTEAERLRDQVEIERTGKMLERRKWLRAEREVDDLYRAIARHRDSGEHPAYCRPCEVCEESDNRLWRTIERTPDERLEVRRQADRLLDVAQAAERFLEQFLQGLYPEASADLREALGRLGGDTP